MKKLNVLLIVIFIIFFSSNVFNQVRIAVLPFQNMDGKLTLNIYSYKLQDSITKVLLEKDQGEKYYHVVPLDSIESILSELNLDPTNPQYPSDVWKAVKRVNVKYVISGNFNIQAERFLINAYIYEVETKLPDLDHQARDIFKSEERIFEAVKIIIKNILPALIPQ